MISLDLETFLIEENYQAPHPVCAVICKGEGVEDINIVPTDGLEAAAHEALDSGDILVNVSMAFDMAVLMAHIPGTRDKILRAYADNRIVDLAVWDKCAQIEQRAGMKRPSLEQLCQAYGVQIMKDQDARTTFGQYYGRPISDYSAEHVAYLLGDGYAPWKLGKRFFDRFADLYVDACWLSRKQFWAQLARNRGMRTDQARVQSLEVTAKAELEVLRAIAQTPMPLPGETIDYSASDKVLDRFRVVRANGKKHMARLREWVTFAYADNPPMTREPKNRKSKKPFKPQVATGKEVLGDSGDPYLESIRDFGEWNSVVNKDLVMLRADTLHTRFWLAETTRSTSAKPNLQNFRRAVGIRECVVPRPGYVLLASDHSGAELAGAAQNAFTYLGRHHMLDMLNAGIDLHVHVGCAVHGGISYEELSAKIEAGTYEQIGGGGDISPEEYAALPERMRHHFKPYSEYRQFAKIPNFGCLGGMSYPPTLAIYARRQGIRMTVDQAEHVLGAWQSANPDGQALLDWVKYDLPKWGHGFEVQIPGSGLVRRGAPYCAAANTLFQGLIAVLEGHVGWELMSAQLDPSHPLGQDCHMVNFVHDEFIQEVPEWYVTPAAQATLEIMTGPIVKRFLPDVKLGAEVTAMRRWSKKAKSKWVGSDGKPHKEFAPGRSLTIWDEGQAA